MVLYYSILGFIFFSLCITVIHELGHYLVARWCGVKVLDFSIGMGKTIWSTTVNGTNYALKLWPVGGYVKMAGMEDGAEQDSFAAQSKLKRISIILAGPLMNYLFSAIILTSFYYAYGRNQLPAIIDEVLPASPAEIAGLRQKDQILKVNDQITDDFLAVQRYIALNLQRPINVELKRDNEIINTIIYPEVRISQTGKNSSGFVGIKPLLALKHVDLSISNAILAAAEDLKNFSLMNAKFIVQLFTGSRSLLETSSFIGIADALGKSLNNNLIDFILLLAMLSVSVGFINLLPIPILDGGHLLSVITESLFGASFNNRVRPFANVIGLMLIFYVSSIAMYSDICSIILNF